MVGSDSKVAPAVRRVLPGWKIARAVNNSSALEMLRVRPYDLVLTGVESSGKQDVDLLQKIRIVRPHVRLIIITRQSTPADVIAAMRERAFSYFSEPYSMDTFEQMLRLATTGPVWDEGIEILSATPELMQLVARCDRKTADRLIQFIHEVANLPLKEKDAVAPGLPRDAHERHRAWRQLRCHSARVDLLYPGQAHGLMPCKGSGGGLFAAGGSSCGRHEPAVRPDPSHRLVRAEQGLRPGGFGILMAKNIIDELIYSENGSEKLR